MTEKTKKQLEAAEKINNSYKNTSTSKIKELAKKAAKKRTYDYASDDTYKGYIKDYAKLAATGAQNAVSDAESLSGGYGNTYASAAASLAHQKSINESKEIIPKLQQAAMDKYDAEQEANTSAMKATNTAEQNKYNKHRDTVSDQQKDREYAYSKYKDEVSNDQWQAKQDYQKERDKVSDTQWEKKFKESQREFNVKQAKKKSSGSGGSSKSSSNKTTKLTQAAMKANALAMARKGNTQAAINYIYSNSISLGMKDSAVQSLIKEVKGVGKLSDEGAFDLGQTSTYQAFKQSQTQKKNSTAVTLPLADTTAQQAKTTVTPTLKTTSNGLPYKFTQNTVLNRTLPTVNTRTTTTDNIKRNLTNGISNLSTGVTGAKLQNQKNTFYSKQDKWKSYMDSTKTLQNRFKKEIAYNDATTAAIDQYVNAYNTGDLDTTKEALDRLQKEYKLTNEDIAYARDNWSTIKGVKQRNAYEAQKISTLGDMTKEVRKLYSQYNTLMDAQKTVATQSAQTGETPSIDYFNQAQAIKKQIMQSEGIDSDTFDDNAYYVQTDDNETQMNSIYQDLDNNRSKTSGLGRVGYDAATTVAGIIGGVASPFAAAAQAVLDYDKPVVDTNSINYTLKNIYDYEQSKNATEAGDLTEEKFGNRGGELAYNIGYSTLQSALMMALGGGMGSAIAGKNAEAAKTIANVVTLPSFGLSAFASTVKEDQEKGFAKKNAILDGLGAGVFEMLFEEISLDKAWDIYNAAKAGQTGVKKTVASLLAQAGIEGSEEVNTDIADAVWNYLVNHDASDIGLSQQEYMDSGMTEGEAIKQTIQDKMQDIGTSFISGAASGGLMALGATAVGSINAHNTAKFVNADTEAKGKILDAAKKAAGTTAQEIANSKSANQITDSDMAQIVESISEATQDNSYIESQVAEDLVKEGQTESEAKENAAKLVEMAQSGVLDEAKSESQESAISEQEAANAELLENEANATVYTNILDGKYSGANEAASAINDVIEQKNADNAQKKAEAKQKRTEAVQSVKNAAVVALTGRKANTANEIVINNKTDEITGTTTVNGKEQVTLASGRTVPAESVNFKNDTQKDLVRTAMQFENDNASKLYVKNFQEGTPVDTYAEGSYVAYNAGRLGTTYDDLVKTGGAEFSMLPAEYAKSMYYLGTNARTREQSEKAPETTAKYENPNAGKVTDNRKNKEDQNLIEFAEKAAKKTGLEIVFADKLASNENGHFQRSLSQICIAACREVKGPDGKTVEIPVNMYSTLVHELAEFSASYNPEGMNRVYKNVLAFVASEYGSKYATKTVKNYQNAYRNFGESDKTYSDASEEFVNDFMGGLALTDEGVRDFTKWSLEENGEAETKNIVQTLVDFFKEIANKIRNYVGSLQHLTPVQHKAIMASAEQADKIRDRFLRVLDDAVTNFQNESNFTEEDVQQYLDGKDIRNSYSFVNPHMDLLDKKYESSSAEIELDVLKERYKRIVDIWDKIGGDLNSKFLNDWNNQEYKDRAFTVFKAQQGYKYNAELSSMCKKGIPLFEAIDQIVKKEITKQLNTNVIAKEEKEILYELLKSKGFEIPCAICYVEQARQREGTIIDAFVNGKVETDKNGKTTKFKLGWNEVLTNVENRMKELGVEYTFDSVSRNIATDSYAPQTITMDMQAQEAFYEALRQLTNEEIERYNRDEKPKNPKKTLKDSSPESVKAVLKGTLPSNLKIFKTLFNNPDSRFKIESDLLYSSMTTKNLATSHHNLYTLFNSQGGVSGYKTKQGTVAYAGDILGKKWTSAQTRKEGGVRNQSNSDFMMYTMLDQAQFYVDLSAKGYYLHAYTKVLAELKLFGLSNAKINASLIPMVHLYFDENGKVDIEKTRENAGLDVNGNPIYDDHEGINHEEAFMLLADPEYSKSISGICIGYSDKHIMKLLDDPKVQEIIGYHDKTDDPNKRYAGARYAKNYNGVNEAVKVKADGTTETVHVGFNQFVIKAEKMFKKNSSGAFEGFARYNGSSYQADDIPKLATDLYLEYCEKKNLIPAYHIEVGTDVNGNPVYMSDHPNYYKLLGDFGLKNSEGHYAPHQKVQLNIPESVPYLENGEKKYISTEEYIKRQLEQEMKVRDDISAALSDTSSDAIIPQFVKRVNKLHSTKEKDIHHAIQVEEWHTGMTDDEVRDLEKAAYKRMNSSQNYVSDTDKWMMYSVGSEKYFALYSIKDVDGKAGIYPTILYASKGTDAINESKILKAILTKIERTINGRASAYGTAGTANRIFRRDWTAKVWNSIANSGSLGRKGNFGNAAISIGNVRYQLRLSYKNCLDNIFEIQSDGRGKRQIKHIERDSSGNELTEEQVEFFKGSQARDNRGNLIRLYHGTVSAGFTEFNSQGHSGTGIFLTDDHKVASVYANAYDDYIPDEKLTYDQFADMVEDFTAGDWSVEKKNGKIILTNAEDEQHIFDTVTEAQNYFVDDYVSYGRENAIYPLYANITNPLVIDGRGAHWDKIKYNEETLSTNDITVIAKEEGYDGVIFKNIIDGGSEVHNVYAVFNSNQVKSVENKEPTEKNDIRYSVEVDTEEEPIFTESQQEVNTLLQQGSEALKNVKISEKATKKVARELIKEYGSSYDVNTLASNMQKLFAYLKENGTHYEDVAAVATQIARPVIENSTQIDPDAKADYDRFRKFVKDTKIKLNSVQKQEVTYAYDSYKNFRNKTFGVFTLTDKGTPLETLWSTLVDESGGKLDAGTTDANMPLTLLDYIENLKPKPTSLSGTDIDTASYDLAMKMISKYFQEQSQEAVDQKVKENTAAVSKGLEESSKAQLEKAAKDLEEKTEEYKKNYRQQVLDQMNKRQADLREAQRIELDRISDQLKDMDSDFAEALKQNNVLAAALVEEERAKLEKRQEQMQAQLDNAERRFDQQKNSTERALNMYLDAQQRNRDRVEARKQREFKEQIEREFNALRRMVENPTKKDHIPESQKNLVNQVITALNAVNLDTGTPTVKNAEYRKQIEKLKEVYQQVFNTTAKQATDQMQTYVMENTLSDISKLVKFAGRSVAEMNSEELATLKDAIKMIRKQVQLSNTTFNNDYADSVDTLAKAAVNEVQNAAHGKNYDTYSPKSIAGRYLESHLDVKREFHRLSGYHNDGPLMSLYQELEDGEMKWMKIHKDVDEMFKEITADKESLAALRDPKNLVDVGLKRNGISIRVTPAMRLAIIMHAENDSNLMHLCGIGLSIPNMGAYAKGDFKEAFRLSFNASYFDSMNLSEEDEKEMKKAFWMIGESRRALDELTKELKETTSSEEKDRIRGKITSWKEKRDSAITYIKQKQQEVKHNILAMKEDLSDYELKVLGTMEKFFHEYSGNALNETSMKMYDYKVARVKNYFPIKSNQKFTDKDAGKLVMDIATESSGTLKSRVQGASNAIYLRDVFDEMLDQTDFIAQYCGYAMPTRDLNLAMTKTLQDYRTDKFGNLRKDGDPYTLSDTLDRSFGVSSTKYIENLLKDINGGRHLDSAADHLLSDIRSKYAGATLVANIGVAMKQAASFPTAAAVVGSKPLMKALKDVGKGFTGKGITELESINPLLWYRSEGNIDEAYTEAQKSKLIRNMPKPLKAMTIDLIGNIDAGTVRTLEYAAKYFVDDQYKAEGKTIPTKVPEEGDENGWKEYNEYWQAVSNIFTRVVNETQPNYSVLERPDILRNPNPLLKQLLMFKTQPFQNMQIIYDAVNQYTARAYDVKHMGNKSEDVQNTLKEEFKVSKVNLARAVGSQAASALVFSIMTIVANTIYHKQWKYKDDDGEWDPWAVVSALGSGVMSSLSGCLAFGDTVYNSIMQVAFDQKNYGLSVSLVDMVNNMSNGLAGVKDYALELFDADTTAKKNAALIKLYTAFDDIAGVCADFTGLPYASMTKTVQSLILYAQDISRGVSTGVWNTSSEMPYMYTTTNVLTSADSQTEMMINALMQGNEEAFEKYRKEAIDAAIAEGKEADEESINKNVLSQLGSQLKEGTATEDDAVTAMQNLGLTDDEIADKLSGWYLNASEDEYNAAADKFLSGDTKGYEAAFNELTASGIDADALQKKISNYVGSQYKDGKITEAQAQKYAEYTATGKDDKEKKLAAYKTVQTWKYDSQYGQMDEVIDKMISSESTSTKELKTVKSEYESYGMDKGDIKSHITSTYKKKYKAASGTEKAAIKAAALAAYKLFGDSDSDAQKKVKKWDEE